MFRSSPASVSPIMGLMSRVRVTLAPISTCLSKRATTRVPGGEGSGKAGKRESEGLGVSRSRGIRCRRNRKSPECYEHKLRMIWELCGTSHEWGEEARGKNSTEELNQQKSSQVNVKLLP